MNGTKYLPVGTSWERGASEELAIEKFLESHPKTRREEITEIEPHSGPWGKQYGLYVIRYRRRGVTGSPALHYVETRDSCASCAGALKKPQRGPMPRFCSDRCRQRACRARKKQSSDGRGE